MQGLLVGVDELGARHVSQTLYRGYGKGYMVTRSAAPPPPPRPVPLAPCKVQSELLPRLAQIMFLFNAAINERDALVAVRDEAHPNSQSTKDFNRKVSKGHNGFMGLGL